MTAPTSAERVKRRSSGIAAAAALALVSLGSTASIMLAGSAPASACDPIKCTAPPCMAGTDDIDCGTTGDNGGQQLALTGRYGLASSEVSPTGVLVDIWQPYDGSAASDKDARDFQSTFSYDQCAASDDGYVICMWRP